MRIMRSVVLVAGLQAALLAGCSDKGKPESPEHPVVKGLTLARVESGTAPELLAAAGTVRARNSARISARVSGTVSAVHAREGDRVRPGALLLSLEAVESSAAAAGAAHGVEEAVARVKLADVTFERYSKLYEDQAVTRQELDTRRAERDTARRALARAREAARAAEAVAGYTRVTSPIGGIVTGRSVDLGATVFPGMPLVTVEEEGMYRLEVTPPESLLGKVKPGQKVRVSVERGGDIITGTVVEIVPAVDPVSRTFTVKLDLPAAGLRSGSFGRAMFLTGEKRAVLVPATAIVERGQLASVWVVDNGNIARMRLVKPGPSHDGRVEILAGLGEGERIVVGGVEKVVDGARVE